MDRMRRLFVTLPVALIGLSACGNSTTSNSAPTGTQEQLPMDMTVQDVAARLNRGDDVMVLDVRSPEEYVQDGHVKGSVLIPLPDLALRLKEVPTNRPIACFCRSGNRSQVAADLLRQKGYPNVANVLGGIKSWRAADLPTEF